MLGYERLASCPEVQYHAILMHYATHASIAIQAHKALKLVRQHPDDMTTAGTDRTIVCIVEQLKKGHLSDLGIPLEWPKLETLNSLSKL